MKKALFRAGVALMAGGAVLALSGPAQAADPNGGPSDNASCVGQVFVPQATGEPGEVAARVAFIKEVILPELGINFGVPISGLAKDACSGT